MGSNGEKQTYEEWINSPKMKLPPKDAAEITRRLEKAMTFQEVQDSLRRLQNTPNIIFLGPLSALLRISKPAVISSLISAGYVIGEKLGD